jgi:inner membrane protein involved in colicin E2 resistance
MLVYGAEVTISGRFATPDFVPHGIIPSQVKWQSAALVLGISGVRAITSVSLDADGAAREIEAGVLPYHPFENGIRAAVPLETVGLAPEPFEFTLKLALNGRGNLSFQPLGRQSEITISSDWPHPSFIGTPLPAKREIGANGFAASWSISHIATGSPLSWLVDEFRLQPDRTTTVGVALTEPGDVHQQTDRIVKYGILVIGLTFGTMFVVGALKRDRVHLVQYLLIGASITLFYLLLLSLAEQMDFALSYLIASLVDIAIVAWYAGATIRRLMGWVTGAILTLVHGYMYVLLQMESFSLLSGTIGLLVALFARARGIEVQLIGKTPHDLALPRSMGFADAWTRETLPELPWDGIVDASTGHELPALALDLVEPGRRLVYIGLSVPPSLIDTRGLVLKDVTAVGILGASAGLAGAIDAYAGGMVDPRPLVAATVSLDEIAGVLAGHDRPPGAGPKIHVDPRL